MLTLKDPAIADSALPGHAEPYRRLDTAVLEALILKGALQMTDEDIDHLNGLGYARDHDQALELVQTGQYDAAFFMSATPVRRVQAGRSRRREHASKVDLFLPKGSYGPALQPPRIERDLRRYDAGRHSAQANYEDSPMKAIARRTESTSFVHRIDVRQHHLTADEPIEHGGDDDAPSPQELLAASLASCTAITMEMYAKRKGWDLGPVEVQVEYTPAERGCPTKFTLALRLPERRQSGADRAPARDRRKVPRASHARRRGDVRGSRSS